MELLWASLALGLPVAAMSWYLARRLYRSGKLSINDDLRAVRKNIGKIRRKDKNHSQQANFLEKRWMKFGGGFYGITAVTTWLIIELGETMQFIVNFPGVSAILGNGIGSFIFNFFVNQLQNFLTALLWFTYWGDDGRNVIIWIAVPYVAYLAGIFFARKSKSELIQMWNDHVKHNPDNENHDDNSAT